MLITPIPSPKRLWRSTKWRCRSNRWRNGWLRTNRDLGADAEMTNQRTLSQRLRCVDPMDQWSSIEERCNLAADELDRLSRIEIKYDNLCPVLNEQAGGVRSEEHTS